MHKIFAKTVFLGKNIINLTECHSTNDLLLQYVKEGRVSMGTIVVSEHQSKGKGQRGNIWESEAGKNLLFSFFIKPDIPVRQQYLLNLLTSQSLLNAIKKLSNNTTNLEVKWPNDLYVNNKKFAGILIESNISGKNVENTVIGVGLNLNQLHFLNNVATSLLAEGYTLNKWQLLEDFCVEFEDALEQLKDSGADRIIRSYHERLRWRNETHVFEDLNNNRFQGVINGIDHIGNLIIITNGIQRSFRIKEVRFIQ